MDDAVRAFTDAARELSDLDGLERGYLFADRDNGVLVTLTLWGDLQHFEASEVRAASLRQQACREADGEMVFVDRCELELDFGG
jgi:heme-degrading monooxygenase HmoA